MLRRVHVVYRAEMTASGCEPIAWRVVEADGRLCTNWLSPDYELDDPEGALDRGGFDDRKDAELFALGVLGKRRYTDYSVTSRLATSIANATSTTRAACLHSTRSKSTTAHQSPSAPAQGPHRATATLGQPWHSERF